MKRILPVISIFLLLSALGCTQSEVEDDPIGVHGLKDVKAKFNLEVAAGKLPETRSLTFTAHGSTQADTLAVGAAPDTLQTRSAVALPDAQEKMVAGLWIGQYNGAGTMLLSSQYLESVAAPAADGQVNVTVKLKKYDNCRIRFVANAGDLGPVATEALLDERTIPYESTADGRPSSNLFAMTALWIGDITGGTARQTLTPVVTLTRLAAKITFTYSVNGTGFSFTPTALRLEQVPDRSQIGIPDPDNPVRPADATYTRSYTGTLSSTGATMYWYLPENMAGTAKAPNAVHSEKEKVGNGVTDPTCIVLTGNAVQNGTKYDNVTFRFYPGKDQNAYNIDRNSHYIMNISLKGLDISDKRITVSDIPPITVDGNIPAAAGSSREVQITSRAGVVWSLSLPPWLSATIDGQTTPAGTTLINQGPCAVTFTAIQANPSGTERSETFTVDAGNGESRSFTLVQEASVFRVHVPTAQIPQDGTRNVTGSIEATQGLAWTISPETSNGIKVDRTSGSGSLDQLAFTAPNNPGESIAPRTGTFLVSVTGADPARTAEVQVTQRGSNFVTIDQGVATEYKNQKYVTLTKYPPFNNDGGNIGGMGTDYKGSSTDATIGTPYSVEVAMSEPTLKDEYPVAINKCAGLGEGWRLPMMIELFAMYQKRATLEAITGFAKFNNDYWSCSVCNGNPDSRCVLFFLNTPGFGQGQTVTTGSLVRCVRDITD